MILLDFYLQLLEFDGEEEEGVEVGNQLINKVNSVSKSSLGSGQKKDIKLQMLRASLYKCSNSSNPDNCREIIQAKINSIGEY